MAAKTRIRYETPTPLSPAEKANADANLGNIGEGFKYGLVPMGVVEGLVKKLKDAMKTGTIEEQEGRDQINRLIGRETGSSGGENKA